MTLLAGEALDIVRHALGGEVHSAITGLRVLNETGRWLYSARPWVFLRGAMESLSFTSGQDYIDLPEDFGAIVAVDRADGFHSSLSMVTPETLLELRTTTPVAAAFKFWGCVTWDHADIEGSASVSGGYTVTPTTAAEARAKKRPTPRLEVYPQPSATNTGALLLMYTRGWRQVLEDTDTIFVPEWLEGVYLRAARIWAQGYDKVSGYDKDGELESLVRGAEWRAAVTHDSNIQTDLGTIEGGAAQRRGWYRHFDQAISSPS